jgi:hypothetical protein
MSEPEEIDLKVWMAQVSDALGEIDTLIAELSDRLVAVEGQNFALTRLLYSLIKQKIVPPERTKKLIGEMIQILRNHTPSEEYQEALFKSAQGVFEKLVDEEAPPPPRPRFSVIPGGKIGSEPHA